MKNYTVYRHVNKINNKQYIGITSQNPPSLRWGRNGNSYNPNTYFGLAIKKYGWDLFSHEILFQGLTKEEACLKEIELIKKYKTNQNQYGYNSTSGGESFTLSDIARKKKSIAMKGNKNSLNIPCSEEKKRKISQAQKGRKFSEEHKKRLSESAKKRHVPCSEKKKKQLSDNYPNKKPVICIETGIVYDSVQQCAKALNLYATNLVKCCKGKINTTKGYHFQYYNSTINAERLSTPNVE